MGRGRLKRSDVGEWLTRIQSAKHFFDNELKKSEENVRLYQRRNAWTERMAADAGLRKGRAYSANYVWANIQALLPSIYSGIPRVLVKARTEGTSEVATAQEKWFNWLLPQIEWRKRRKRSIRTALLRGWAPTKIVWKPYSDAARPEDEAEPVTETRGEAQGIPPGTAYIEPVPVQGFLCDPDANLDLTKARWIAFRVRRHVDEIKEDRSYKASRERVRGGVLSTSFSDFYQGRPTPTGYEDQTLAEIYEIWVRRVGQMERRLLSISPNVDEELRFEDWPYTAIENYPASILVFHEHEHEEDVDPALATPEVRSWIPLQRAINTLFSKAISHVDRFDRQFAVDSTGLESPSELEKLAYGGDGAFIKASKDPRTVVHAIDWGALPPEYFAAINLAKGFLDEISGVGEIQRGQAPASTAATTATFQQQNASLRAQDRRIAIAEDDVLILRLMKQIAQEFSKEAIMVPVAEGAWLQVRPEDLREELDVRIDIDSIAPESVEQRKGRWLSALQLVGPVLNARQGVPAGMWELLRRTLHDLGFEDETAFLPPLEQGVPENEHTQWLLGRHPQVLASDDHASHIAYHQAFAAQPEVAAIPGLAEEIQGHISNHQDETAKLRATGGLSVRGRLRPMAPAPGTPGGMTGAPMSEESMNAPPGLSA